MIHKKGHQIENMYKQDEKQKKTINKKMLQIQWSTEEKEDHYQAHCAGEIKHKVSLTVSIGKFLYFGCSHVCSETQLIT